MGAVELGGERSQLVERARVIVERPGRRSRCLTAGRSRSGRWSSTLRSLWRIQRCTGARRRARRGRPCGALWRRRSRRARPARGRGRARPGRRAARSRRSRSRSSLPRARAGSSTPSVVIPSATTFVRPFSSIPSSISTASRTSSRRRLISASRFSRVRATNCAADRRLRRRARPRLDLARRPAPGCADSGASRRRRASARAPPRSADRGRRSARRSQAAPRSRRRRSAPAAARPAHAARRASPRPPRGRDAPRPGPGSWRPFGPTTSSTSSSISSASTPSPTPTLSASSPSFAAPDQLPQRLLHPDRQHGLRAGTACARDTVTRSRRFLLRSLTDRLERSQQERTRPEGPPSSSTSYGTTSGVGVLGR